MIQSSQTHNHRKVYCLKYICWLVIISGAHVLSEIMLLHVSDRGLDSGPKTTRIQNIPQSNSTISHIYMNVARYSTYQNQWMRWRRTWCLVIGNPLGLNKLLEVNALKYQCVVGVTLCPRNFPLKVNLVSSHLVLAFSQLSSNFVCFTVYGIDTSVRCETLQNDLTT